MHTLNKEIKMWLFYALSTFLVSNIAMIPFNDIIKTETFRKSKFVNVFKAKYIGDVINII